MPYRLERGNMSERSQLVRGWKHATHSFWGLCDEQHRASTVRESVQYKWEPASCSDGIPPGLSPLNMAMVVPAAKKKAAFGDMGRGGPPPIFSRR